ncbi:MAG TPA: patatin-like phospholipase family protein [Pirellulales bacterium]|jgi:NTE family protein|nr:patatin-like phospholipase family protein [Pirellulales bacterium]
MFAYGVFAGGGVKGAALAGCLYEAQKQGIAFVGHAGTSAGAIVALLANVGYSGSKIYQLLKGEIHPLSMLDDGGTLLLRAMENKKRGAELCKKRTSVFRARKYWRLWKECSPVRRRMIDNLGLYSGDALRQTLFELVRRKLAQRGLRVARKTDFSFSDLREAGFPPLKIVTSDIINRRVVVFSSETEPDASVIRATRASAGYPFLFRPERFKKGHELVDGGLCSNLPSFVFLEEQRILPYPILAFNFRPPARDPSGYFVVDFGYDLMVTALESSDNLVHSLNLDKISVVDVRVPDGVDTLKFDLKKDDIQRLFRNGRDDSAARLKTLPVLEDFKLAGGDPSKELMAYYGDPSIFVAALQAFGQMMTIGGGMEMFSAAEVRTNIMLPTGKYGRTRDGEVTRMRRVVYHWNFKDDKKDADRNLELAEFAGCTGQAIQKRRISFANLEVARQQPDRMGLTDEQVAMVRGDRRTMISAPIFMPQRRKAHSVKDLNLPIIGVLSVDTSSTMKESGWFADDSVPAKPALKEEAKKLMRVWSEIFARLLVF